jgi:hypothetical protein
MFDMSRKSFLSAAGILSLAAQGVLFAPAGFEFILQSIPGPTQTLLTLTLGAISFILYFITFKKYLSGSQVSWIFLAIQICTVIGVFFLLNDSASRDREAGFRLTGIITLLTTYALYTSSKPISHPNPQPVMNDNIQSDFMQEPGLNASALNEQIDSLTRQLLAEKYRTTQLILLNELSQQLEAELDPPVSAQLAVNTLERAMDCSLVALYIHEPEEHAFVVLAAAGKMTSLLPTGYRQDSNIGLLGRTTRFKKTHIINDTRLETDFF